MENSSWDDRDARAPLLGDTDLPPVQIINPQGRSSFLLVGDHAGTAIPAALGTLGLSSDELGRHIAVDIGIQALGEALAAALDATFICQHYSRLVIDCNRDPETQDAMPDVSDGTIISGNAALSAYDRERRIAEIHTPYQAEIARCLAQADADGRRIILVSLHSFAPTLGGIERP
jgi:predicted N-formylglutamate amidohydrolase